MLLNDDEIAERIESPLNLLNRLKTSLSRATNLPPIPGHMSPAHTPILIPQLPPPTSSDIIDDLEEKISKSAIRGKASGILTAAMDELQIRIADVQKPERLAEIAERMNKIVSSHERKEGEKQLAAQIIVYAPQIQKLENFEVIDVAE